MSYARWSWDSDVYVFLDVDGYLQCHACNLDNPDVHGHRSYSTDDALLHLACHVSAGDLVSEATFLDLIHDKAENDEWMTMHPLSVQRGLR